MKEQLYEAIEEAPSPESLSHSYAVLLFWYTFS